MDGRTGMLSLPCWESAADKGIAVLMEKALHICDRVGLRKIVRRENHELCTSKLSRPVPRMLLDIESSYANTAPSTILALGTFQNLCPDHNCPFSGGYCLKL